jgi:hypothetical protein
MTNPTTQANPLQRRLGRSVAAVFAGLVTVVALDTGIDAVMHSTGVYPPRGQTMADTLFLLALAYRMMDGTVGGYIAAWLAPYRPVKHALILGSIGFVLATAGAAATWNKGPEFGPRWYPLAIMGNAVPCAWAGGKLFARRAGSNA